MQKLILILIVLCLFTIPLSIINADEGEVTDDVRAIQKMTVGKESNKVAGKQAIDKELQERMKYLGLIIPDHVRRRFEKLDKQPPPVLLSTEDVFDWRVMGGVTPVKNQGQCGSCWDFAATGAFESSVLINTEIEMDLSEQQVLSCNTGGSSCGGGWMEDAYYIFMNYGAVYESCMPYEADDGVPCTQENCDPIAWMVDFVDIPNNVSAIKNAVLEGPVSTTFMVYEDFHWNCFWHEDTGDLNHAVVIVGWDDTMCGGTGAWIVKNSWGTGWGDNGYFYMPYGSSGIGRYAQRPIFESVNYLSFTYTSGLPDFIDLTGGTTISVVVDGVAGSPEPGTGILYYNSGSGWQNTLMQVVSPNNYNAVFPEFNCEIYVNYYFSAETDQGDLDKDPSNAPSSSFSAFSANPLATIFEDNFNTDMQWTVINDCSDGQWGRGIPTGGGTRGDPPTDYDGSGYCYVTDNVEGNSDVDDGYTYLISPTLDLSDSDAMLLYALWYTNYAGNDPNNDLFKVYVSNNNGGTWIHVETFGPETHSGWEKHSFVVGDYVTPTSQVKVRFEASDLNDGSVVEAGIDAVSVITFDCESASNGTIAGTVTDISGPITGVQVFADDGLGNTGSDVTLNDGTYSIDVPASTYEVSFSHVDYRDTTVTDVVVIENETTTVDVVMDELPTEIPTLSEWGMIILALLILAMGTIAIIRRHRAVTGWN